jgi:hypothetical protein
MKRTKDIDFVKALEDARARAQKQERLREEAQQEDQQTIAVLEAVVMAKEFLADSEPEREKFELQKEAHEKMLSGLRDEIAQLQEARAQEKKQFAEERALHAQEREKHAEFLSEYEKKRQQLFS